MEKCTGDLNEWFLAVRRSKLSVIQKLSKNLDNVDAVTTHSINEVEHKNVTGLILAAYIGNKDVVRWFLNNKADPNSSTNLGWRPIHFAAKRGHVTTVDMLVASGADVDVYTKKNETPLLLAQSTHMWDTVRKLIQLGASFDDKTEALLVQSAQKNYPSNDCTSKKKKFSENFQAKYNHKNIHEVTSTAHISISNSCGLFDLHTDSLIKQLQFQSYGYDYDLSRQKWDLASQMLSLPPPFPNRHYNRFSQLLKRVISANLSQRFRISAAKQLIELLDSLEPNSSVSTQVSKSGTTSSGIRSVETHLRVLEITVCEKHCPDRLVALIGGVCTRLVIFFELYQTGRNDNEPLMNLPTSRAHELTISYISQMLRSLSCSKSSQFRAGMLSFISRILFDCDSSEHNQNAAVNMRDSQLCTNLISDLVVFTDSLDQAENVSRLARFISLVGEYSHLEFSKRFSDLADILLGWCVDASSSCRGVAVCSLLFELSCNLSRWWFDLARSDDGYVLASSTCDMIEHLLEDADSSLQRAVSEYRQISTNFGSRRSGQVFFVSTEVSQKLVAANLYFSVLAGICSGVLKYSTESPQPGPIKFASLDFSDWIERLLNVLHGIDFLSPVVVFKQKPTLVSRTYVPPAYCLPLLTYGDIIQHVHDIIFFTLRTMPLEGDNFGQKVKSYLGQPPNESLIQPSPRHVKMLCELVSHLLNQTQQSTPGLVISTFKALFGTDTLLHRMKTSSGGSSAIFDLLCHLSERHLSGCDILTLVVEMCIADLQLACTKLADDKNPDGLENELLVFFSTSLFATVWRSVSDEPERVPFASAAHSRVILILADLQRKLGLFMKISQRVRLTFWSVLISAQNYGIDRASECAGEFSFIVKQLLLTASNNLQELILSKHLLQSLSVSLATQLSYPFCAYLLRLLQDAASPVRAKDGAYFCEAVGFLIRSWVGKKPKSEILELAYMCVNHPLPRVQSSGADLLLVFGLSLAKFESTRTINFLLHWYLGTSLELSTSLITCPSISAANLGTLKENDIGLLRAPGAFPSLPAAAGVLGILTRGAPYLSDGLTSRLGLLIDSYDWLRRLACLISPLATDGNANWYAMDTSPLTLVFFFTTWSMVDYKLKVAPWANPVKTFLSIEAIIHALLSNLTRGTNQTMVPELQTFHVASSVAVTRQSRIRQIHQSALVINFMSLLEKATTNAMDGFAAITPSILPTAHAFFKANAATCYQWFNRVRMPLAILASWVAPLSLEGSEATATVIWNAYSLLRQVPTTDPSELLNAVAVFGNPEKIILCIIQALYQLGAADELDHVHAYLERTLVNSIKPGLHLYSWVHGLVCILEGRLDEGLSCFSTFFGSYPIPSCGSFGALSCEFARRLFIAILVRAGSTNEVTLQLCSKKEFPEGSMFCNNQGDTPAVKCKFLANNGKREVMDDLPIRHFDIADQRLQALLKLSTWDNAISSLSSANSIISIPTEQENRLLLHGPDSISDVIDTIRRTASAVISLADFNGYRGCSVPRLDPESSLSSLVLETDLLINGSNFVPAVGDIGIGTWSLLTKKGENLSVFLDACEPLLIPCNGDYFPIDSCKVIASNLLRQQLTSLDIRVELTNYGKLVNVINEKTALSSLDRLRLIRFIANLLWISGGGTNDRIAAMTCLSEGLMHSILENKTTDVVAHTQQCLLNASVALQLFKFLTFSTSTSTQGKESESLCREVFVTCSSDARACETENRDARCLVQNLLKFGRLASSPWVDGVPLISPSEETEPAMASSPSELQMRLLMFATHLSPTNASAQAWLHMAHWCYERGQHDVKQIKAESERVLAITQLEPITTTLFDALTPDERQSLSQLVPPEISGEDKTIEVRILAKLYTFLGDNDDDLRSHRHCIDDLSANDVRLDNSLRRLLADHLSRGTNLTTETLALDGPLLSGCSSLASLLITRLYTLHSFAAQAYVTFLSVAGQHINEESNALKESIRPLQPKLATLRLLHLLDEPCRFLRNTVRNLVVHGNSNESPLLSPLPALTTAHSGPLVWAGCLPQILDRLGHPDPAVRRCLVDLLARLIRMTNPESPSTDRALPNQLVFPSIVGSKGIDCAQLDVRARSHGELVTTLCNTGYGKLVGQVFSFVMEMRRIAVLWEELWSGVLIQHVDDLNRKVNAFERDIKNSVKTLATSSNTEKIGKSDENTDAVARMNSVRKLRYEALLAPTFSIIQQLCALTLEIHPQTSHEAWFQNTFKQYIEETVTSLKKFCSSPVPASKSSPVAPLQRLLSRFQTLNQKAKVGDDEKTRFLATPSRSMSLLQISPNLFALNGNLEIPLPGRAYLHLARVGPKISVYPTKTRPKRIVFWTEEGQSYPYLLKCLEDLRLDARIMDLMRLTNTAFRSKDVARSAITTARTYSVTPIGPKAGLIQMVQGAMPLFTLYKRWQQRKVVDASLNGIVGELSSLPLPKPSELFYNKLKEFLPPPLTTSSPRSLWPKDVLLKVFYALESETPADLLTRELWAASPNMSAWWRASLTFASSLGITSAFGYLIGLGDRHLDNLLIDLTTGRLIHIDFNVCFDEGLSLRVPELVPFRFTRILRHPLGPLCDPSSISTGGGGTFGANFLLTLGTCSSIQELFRIQLQSFEIDPPIDWMRATTKESPWTTFDLAYFAAYRAGCLSTSADTLSPTDREQVTKKRRVFERLLVELQRYAGLLAARFAEIHFSTDDLCEQLYSTMKTLEENLQVWGTLHKNQSRVEEIIRQLAILKDIPRSGEQLAGFESRCREAEEKKQQVLKAKSCLCDFATSMEDDITNALRILAKWLTRDFSLPDGVNQDLVQIISDYRNVARSYIIPDDSPLHFAKESTQWFSTKRLLISALRESLASPILKTGVTASFKQLFNLPSYPLPDMSTSTRIQSILIEAEAHLDTMKSQHFIPPSFALNDLSSLFVQGEASLTAFIGEQDAAMILPAFKLSLIKNLAAVIHSMFALEPLEHIDFLHQHLGFVTCASSVLDPSGRSTAMPFWAGHEADASCELQFFLTLYQFITKLIELRDNLCNLLLPKLEEAIQEVSHADLGALIHIRKILHEGEVEGIQNEVNQLLVQNAQNPLSEVLLATHLALLNAASVMEELCQRLNDYPITAVTWVRVDVISRAIANLQGKCSVEQGATSLWGWRRVTEQDTVTTWFDEVYMAGMEVFLKVTLELCYLWLDVRDGRLQHHISSVPYATALESEFITRLADRLALVSESVLACGRLILSLLEESGFSVRQAIFEIERMIPLPHLRGPPTVFVDRMIHSAELFFLTVQPPEVQALFGMAGSVLASLFASTSSYVSTAITTRELYANEAHVKLLRNVKQVFDWLHNLQDLSATSLRNCLKRLQACITEFKTENEHVDGTALELCDLGDAICSAEYDRLFESPDVDKVLTLLADYDSQCQTYIQLGDELETLHSVLLKMKNEYFLDWPATGWAKAYVPGPNGTAVPLVEALSNCLVEAQEELAHSVGRLDSLTLALTGDTASIAQKSSGSKNRKKKKNSFAVPFNENYEGEVANLLQIRQIFSDFKARFLSEMHPYVKQLLRLSQLSSNAASERIWFKWLECQETWSVTAERIVQNFSALLTRLSTNTVQKDEGAVFSLVGLILNDCLEVRNNLTPLLTKLIQTGIWTTLKNLESPILFASTLRKLGFDEEKLEVGVESQFSGSSMLGDHPVLSPSSDSLAQEQISPQAMEALQRLCRRLQGVDMRLSDRSDSSAMSLTEQADLCVRAAMDPKHLSAMFEGWTPWV